MGATLIIWRPPLVSLGTQGLTFLTKHNKEWDRNQGSRERYKATRRKNVLLGQPSCTPPQLQLCADWHRAGEETFSFEVHKERAASLHSLWYTATKPSPRLQGNVSVSFYTCKSQWQAEAEAETNPELESPGIPSNCQITKSTKASI